MSKRKAKDVLKYAIGLATGEYGHTEYSNEYPYNVGHWNFDTWSFDCLGFVHTICNGFSNNHAKLGGGAVMDDFVNCTGELATLNTCDSISRDFTNIKPAELLYMDGHVGFYVGEVQIDRGGCVDVYNVAECTPSFGDGGCMLTYVDKYGNRFNKKGGTQRGAWTHHGTLDRVDYTEEATPAPTAPTDPTEYADFILGLVAGILHGVYGNNPQRKNTITVTYGEKAYTDAQHIVNELFEL